MQLGLELAERGWLPDAAVRLGIRRLLAERQRQLAAALPANPVEATRAFARGMTDNPLVVAADSANAQHYEAPTEFFQRVLGKRMKYSCGYWPKGVDALDASEEAMLALTCERAELQDGMTLLDLGCGWGALSLWVAQRFPHCRIRALSNSATQRAYIESQCREHGFSNVAVATASVADFDPQDRFDRVISVEMFEHVRNYDALLRRVAGWLRPDGKLLVHVFCHALRPYYFEPETSGDWMARNFFTGGIMPSRGLLGEFPRDLAIERQWSVWGVHYQRTCEAWLQRLDAQRDAVGRALAPRGPAAAARRATQRWRMFFMACAELFGTQQGSQWHVEHYLMRRPS